jgi:tetratricopeptide (TPR) repeat protein
MSSKEAFSKLVASHQWAGALEFLNDGQNNHLFEKQEFIQCNTLILVALGNEKVESGQFEPALAYYNQAFKFTPNHVDCFIGIAHILKLNNQFAESEKVLLQGLEAHPRDVRILNDLGNIKMLTGSYEAAKTYYFQAIDIDPNYPMSQFNLSKYYLANDQYHKGFDLYEMRFKTDKYALEDANFIEKKWRGEDLTGKTLFVLSEQGFGDSILFARFVRELKQACKQLIFCCKKPLQPLYQDQGLGDTFQEIEEGLPEFDYHIPLLSIPRVRQLGYESISGGSYIKPSADKVENWKNKLLDPNKLNVGLVTQGGVEFSLNALRSCPFEEFNPLFELPNVDYYSLQPTLDPKAIAHIENFHHFANEFKDFSETAGFIQSLDLVITVDSVIAHLAGAMGKPVWILAYFPPTWHWGIEGKTTPWYDSARLFRQPNHQVWTPVIEELTTALKEKLKDHS